MKKKYKAQEGLVNNFLMNLGMNLTAGASQKAVATLMNNIGSKNLDEQFNKASLSSLPIMMNGGVNVNAEGGEVIGMIGSDLSMNINGPSHSEGGVDMTLPQGGAIYSDKLKYEGKTFAERKKIRDKMLEKLELGKKSSKINENTYNRMKQNLSKQDMKDLSMQQQMNGNKEVGDSNPKAMLGIVNNNDPNDKYYGQEETIIPNDFILPKSNDPFSILDKPSLHLQKGNPQLANENVSPNSAFETNNTIDKNLVAPEKENFFKNLMNISPDQQGMISQRLGAVSPLAMTLANRATDKPNVNYMKDVGKDAILQANLARESAKASGNTQLDDIRARLAATRFNNNRSGASASQLASLNLASDIAGTRTLNQAQGQIDGRIAQMDLGISQMQGQFENIRQQGEQQRDLADRQDKDAFFTNLSNDFTTAFEGGQIDARNKNSILYNKDVKSLIQKYKQGLIDINEFSSSFAAIMQAGRISQPQTKSK